MQFFTVKSQYLDLPLYNFTELYIDFHTFQLQSDLLVIQTETNFNPRNFCQSPENEI